MRLDERPQRVADRVSADGHLGLIARLGAKHWRDLDGRHRLEPTGRR